MDEWPPILSPRLQAFYDHISALVPVHYDDFNNGEKGPVLATFLPSKYSKQMLEDRDVATAILSHLLPVEIARMCLVNKGIRKFIVKQHWVAAADKLMFTPSAELPKFRICPWQWPRREIKLDNNVLLIQNVHIIDPTKILSEVLSVGSIVTKILMVDVLSQAALVCLDQVQWESHSYKLHHLHVFIDRLFKTRSLQKAEHPRQSTFKEMCITPIHLGAFAFQYHYIGGTGSNIYIFSTDCERLLTTIPCKLAATVACSGASMFIVTTDSVVAYCPGN